MRALLLAAGFGTRLQPLTITMPKCLVPIHGKPLLEIWLEKLSQAGVMPFLVNTHYLASQVESFVATSSFRNQITLFHEPILLGTAGTLVANLDFFQGEDGLLIHADNYCRADLSAFINAHIYRPPECIMTMLTFRTDHPASCGIVELNSKGIVTAFHEKVSNPPGNLANGAVYIISAVLIDRLKQWFSAKDFSNDVLPQLVGKIFSFETKEIFFDIGTPQNYNKANHSINYENQWN